jgi:putative PIN family toxin of toxin-antitoxin system
MIYLQAAVSESGPAATLLRLVESGAFSLFVSDDILGEVRDVLSRRKIRDRNPKITDERVGALIARLRDKATVVNNVRRHLAYPRDPKDEKYVNLAIEAEADYLVSRDNDLLDLMTGHADEYKDFRRRFRALRILDPVEFLKIVMPEETDKPIQR